MMFNAVSNCGEQRKCKRRNGSRTRGYWKLEKTQNNKKRRKRKRRIRREEEEKTKRRRIERRERREFRERREHRNLELLQMHLSMMPAAPIKEYCASARNLFQKTVDV